MRRTLYPILVLLLSMSLFTFIACEDDDDEDLTVAEELVGVWLANSTVGDLGAQVAGSGSLASAGWFSYQFTLFDDGTFAVEGENAFDDSTYGDGDGTIHYSGTYTIDDSADPMLIDLTCTASDNIFFTIDATLQPMQPGIFSLNSAATELNVQWGSTAFAVPRPTEFIDEPGTLVKQ